MDVAAALGAKLDGSEAAGFEGKDPRFICDGGRDGSGKAKNEDGAVGGGGSGCGCCGGCSALADEIAGVSAGGDFFVTDY